MAEHRGWLPSPGFRAAPLWHSSSRGVSGCLSDPPRTPSPKSETLSLSWWLICVPSHGTLSSCAANRIRAEAPCGAVPRLQVHTCEAPLAISTGGSSDQTHAKQFYPTRTLSFFLFLSFFPPALPSLRPLPSLLPFFLSRVSFQEMGILFFHLIQSQILAPPFKPLFAHRTIKPSANVITSVHLQAHAVSSPLHGCRLIQAPSLARIVTIHWKRP